jgi:orotate phosphoribosyltransferase
MHLVPTEEEILTLLRRTGGLRKGHFEYPNGLHTDEYLQVALTVRNFEASNFLAVSLSRLLRANQEIRAMLPNISIVSPATGGIPVAYAVCEALRARSVYWAERENETEPMRFRQFLEVQKGEKVVLVDDILRSGKKLLELKQLVESHGGEVVAVAVVISQPLPDAPDFKPLPFISLATLDATYYKSADACDLCEQGIPLVKTWV